MPIVVRISAYIAARRGNGVVTQAERVWIPCCLPGANDRMEGGCVQELLRLDLLPGREEGRQNPVWLVLSHSANEPFTVPISESAS